MAGVVGVGSGELVTKTALFPWARGGHMEVVKGGEGGVGGIKNHSTQQLNPIPLIPAGMPERQTPIGLRLN